MVTLAPIYVELVTLYHADYESLCTRQFVYWGQTPVTAKCEILIQESKISHAHMQNQFHSVLS